MELAFGNNLTQAESGLSLLTISAAYWVSRESLQLCSAAFKWIGGASVGVLVCLCESGSAVRGLPTGLAFVFEGTASARQQP